MKTLKLTFAGYVLIACVLSFIFSNYSILRSSGASDTEKRAVTNFIKLAVSIPGNVTVTQSKDYNLILEGSKEDLKRIESEVSNNKLTLKVKGEEPFKGKVSAQVSAPLFNALIVTGDGILSTANNLEAKSLELTVSGSGSLKASAEVSSLTSRVSGSGTISLNGTSRNHTVTVSGSGKVKAFNLKSTDVSATISGSGNAEVHASDNLTSTISGSGSILYQGSPKISKRISGSGDVMPSN